MPTPRRSLPPLALWALAALAALAACSSPKGDAAGADSPAATPAAAAASGAPSAEEARQAIDAGNARFVEGLKRGDTASLAALYADDAVSMPPNEPARRGRDGIAKGFAADFAKWTMTDEKLATEDVMVAGDLAVETGTYDASMKLKAGGDAREKGKYLTVWKRQPGGGWKIVRDVFNADAPPPK